MAVEPEGDGPGNDKEGGPDAEMGVLGTLETGADTALVGVDWGTGLKVTLGLGSRAAGCIETAGRAEGPTAGAAA